MEKKRNFHRGVSIAVALGVGGAAIVGSAHELLTIGEKIHYGWPPAVPAALDGIAILCALVLARRDDSHAKVALVLAGVSSVALQVASVFADWDATTPSVVRTSIEVAVHIVVVGSAVGGVHLLARLFEREVDEETLSASVEETIQEALPTTPEPYPADELEPALARQEVGTPPEREELTLPPVPAPTLGDDQPTSTQEVDVALAAQVRTILEERAKADGEDPPRVTKTTVRPVIVEIRGSASNGLVGDLVRHIKAQIAAEAETPAEAEAVSSL